MRTSPYSIDLRVKVIEYIKNGNTQRSAAQIYKLNHNTVSTWYMRYRREGHCLPKKRVGAAPKIDKDKFISYVNNNSNMTSQEIGQAFGISAAGARYWLSKLGYSYKKKPLPMWKQRQNVTKHIKKQ